MVLKIHIYSVLMLITLCRVNGSMAKNLLLPNSITEISLQKAQKHLADYQYDSSSFYYEKALAHSTHVHAAKVGLSRVSILQLDVQRASHYHEQVSPEIIEGFSDSLRSAHQLNEAVIEAFITGSKEKLATFINQTHGHVPDLLLAYEWYLEILIEERLFEAVRDTLNSAHSLLENYPDDTAEKFRICFMLQEANLLFTSSKINQTFRFYETQVFPALAGNGAIWAKYLRAETYRLAGIHYELVKKYDRALTYQHQYLKLIDGFHSDGYFRHGEVYQAIANIYRKMGYYSLSDEYSVKAAKVYTVQAPQNELFLARVHYYEGLLQLRQKQYPEALSKFADVVALESKDRFIKRYKMEAMLQQMEIYRTMQNAQLSQVTYEQLVTFLSDFKGKARERHRFRIEYAHLRFLEQDQHNKLTAQTYLKLAAMVQRKVRVTRTMYLSFMNDLTNYLVLQGKPDSALTVTNMALSRYAKRLENPDQSFISNELNYLIKAAFLKAEVIQKLPADGNREVQFVDALNCYDQAISWHLLTRQGYKPLADELLSETPISALFENAIRISYELFQSTNDQSYITRAFQYSEISKSHQLFEALTRNLLIRNSNIPDSLIMDLRSLRAQTSFLKSELRKLGLKPEISGNDSVLMADYKDLLLEGAEHTRKLMAFMEDNYKNYYQINFGKPFMGIRDVQQHLNTDEGLMEYFQGENHIYSFAISTDAVVFHREKAVSEAVLSAYKNILIPDSTGLGIDESFNLFLHESNRLYDLLLGHSLRKIGAVKKLFIIPDKSLFFLPMEQLLTSATTTTDFGNLPYLIRQYQISYGYSASILFQPDVVAADEFSGRLLAFAPSYEDHAADPLNKNRQIDQMGNLTNLKYNQEEVVDLNEYLPGITFTGVNATESQFYESAQAHDILHFAMHGLLDLDEPQNSRLAFADNPQDPVHDGFLHNFEIYNLSIPAQLVVLSACNTGVGKVVGGEGAMSLSRAFTYAGVQAVVMTQWPADDQSSSLIMKSFYQYLADGLPKDNALRLAKLDYLNTAHPFKKNPYYWNNFSISGKMRPLIITQSPTYWWWAIGVTVLVIILLMYRRQYKSTL